MVVAAFSGHCCVPNMQSWAAVATLIATTIVDGMFEHGGEITASTVLVVCWKVAGAVVTPAAQPA